MEERKEVFYYAVDEDGFGIISAKELIRDEGTRSWMPITDKEDFESITPEFTKCLPPITWNDEPIQIEMRRV